MVAEFIGVTDPRWHRFLERVSHDFYHLPEYVALCARNEGGEPGAFYAESDDAAVLAPLLFRPLPESLGAPSSWRDASSPYGYPSPLFSSGAEDDAAEALVAAFHECARDADLVSVFSRLHPLLPQPVPALESKGAVVKHGPTVYVDLAAGDAEIWRQTRRDHRALIRKLREADFRAVFDDWSLAPEFYRIYAETMERVDASESYLFPDEYFEDLHRALGAGLHLCTVMAPDGPVAAAGLFTEVDGIVQYHLSGTDARYRRAAPAKLMLHAVTDWALKRGDRWFHLGGGVGAQEDSLFAFKAGFSRCRGEFCTFRMIANPERYARLVEASGFAGAEAASAASGFFPQYRRDGA
jgi:hypothetical protein